jgi:hypothetical protein
MNELRYPTWQETVRLALLDFNTENKKAAYDAAVAAIEARQIELANRAEHHDERVALRDATNTLKVVFSES